jgi:uncharacterized protein (DUF2141 family)
MKNFVIIMNVVLVIILFSSTLYSQNSIIFVKVIGIEEIKGDISIGLFNDPDGFPKRSKNSIGARLNVDEISVEHTFTMLNNGVYAIAIYHDENGNGELDRNFFGMPNEDYVFSNYATGSFGPPSFEDAKFELVDSLSIVLDLRGE